MEDILANVELHSPDDFPSIDALRSFLLETGSTPGDFEENCLKEEEALREETEERTLFCGYIQSLTDEALRAVEPLPFHRPLEDQREEQFRRRLWETWGVPEKGGWYQIVGGEKPPPPHILAFNTWEFGERIPLDLLRACQRLRPVL